MVDENSITSTYNLSEQAALYVAQDAITALIDWCEAQVSFPTRECREESVSEAVRRAKQLLNFEPTTSRLGALRLLFDDVKLSDGNGSIGEHWCPMEAIANESPKIPYPISERPTHEEDYKQDVANALKPYLSNFQNWNNLSLLSLILEKYGSCLSCGKRNTALVDIARITGAVAAALAHNPNAEDLSLVAGDLSGIQNFIYTISSDGALKSLRARSFYLELVTEEVVQQLLSRLQLPRTSVIYAGGGNLYLLAPYQADDDKTLTELKNTLNNWLRQSFQGKVFLALAHHSCQVKDISGERFRETWNEAIAKVNQQKTQKFKSHLSDVLKISKSYDPCRVCHRDDTEDLAPLNPLEPDSPQSCPMCWQMFDLGSKLFKIKSMVRSRQEDIKGIKPNYLKFEIGDSTIYYHLFEGRKPIIDHPEYVLLVNNWFLEDYAFSKFQGQVSPLLIGNYFNEDENLDGFQTAEEFAEISKSKGCIPRVGYLRMDVDHLGQIFANGLATTNSYSLPRVAGLSRQMSYFFKTYLNSLAHNRKINLPEKSMQMQDGDRPNLLFIYAGGDDLFVSGAWNEVTEFAFDVYQSFRTYTGWHQDIAISGGVSLSVPKFPLYQAAAESGEAEEKAKGNGRDSLGLFGEVFKWREWFGTEEKPEVENLIREVIKQRNTEDKKYWQQSGHDISNPSLIGIMPFVRRILQARLQSSYSQSFVRNLLATSLLHEQKIKDIEEKRKIPDYKYQLQDVKYYLHLPQIAYTLARLPRDIFKDDNFRQSLKSPYNSPYFRAIATWIELLTRNV